MYMWIHDFNESCAQHGAYVLARDLLNDPVKLHAKFYQLPPCLSGPGTNNLILPGISQPSALF
jgi:hypothetical protein